MDENKNTEEEIKNHFNEESDENKINQDNINGNEEELSTQNKEGDESEIDEKKPNLVNEELIETKDKLLRALAENENTRKQMEKVRIESSKYGVQPLAREILNVVDNFDRALSTKSDNNEKALEEGLILIKKEILDILEKFNVKKINALGENFNANFHQAMFEKDSTDFEQGQICEIVQEGYTFHDRLLRPVLAGVVKKAEEKVNTENDVEKNDINNEKNN